MPHIAVVPGSFDPITIGHYDIIKRALPLFDEVIIAIGTNSQKKYLFSLEDRLSMIEKVFADEPKVKTDTYKGLTVNYCKSIGAKYLLRGIRSVGDFEYERTISQLNNSLSPELETVFFICQPQYSHVSSTIVREIMLGKADASKLLPPGLEGLTV